MSLFMYRNYEIKLAVIHHETTKSKLEPQFSYNGYTLLVSRWGFLKLRRSD